MCDYCPLQWKGRQTRRSQAAAAYGSTIHGDLPLPVFALGDKVIAVYYEHEGGGRGIRGEITALEGSNIYTVTYWDTEVETGHIYLTCAFHVTPTAFPCTSAPWHCHSLPLSCHSQAFMQV